MNPFLLQLLFFPRDSTWRNRPPHAVIAFGEGLKILTLNTLKLLILKISYVNFTHNLFPSYLINNKKSFNFLGGFYNHFTFGRLFNCNRQESNYMVWFLVSAWQTFVNGKSFIIYSVVWCLYFLLSWEINSFACCFFNCWPVV